MSRLKNLIREVDELNPQLAADLAREVSALSDRRAFGLNFERHVPESVELPGRPIRRGDKVRFRPKRGAAPNSVDEDLWRVVRVKKSGKKRIAELARLANEGDAERVSRDTEDLVAVAEFRDPIYPGLVPTGRVERGGDKPFHTVINAENYHALEALLYTHEGKVDAIYIDPPYNTGAKDWKYNNDYVDGEDQYRHSKWLAMMERRLMLAKRLLNPENSVLIVTIDEKEFHRLSLLIQQSFPDARAQVISSLINPAAVARKGYFGRSDEYIIYVMIGAAGAEPLVLDESWITTKGRTHQGEVRWDLLRKSGSSPTRDGHPETFYAFFVTNDGKRIHSVGEPIGVGAARHAVDVPDGSFAVWPIRRDGSEGRWRLQPSTVRKVIEEGCVRIGGLNGERTPIYYLAEGERAKIATGLYEVVGRRDDGSLVTNKLDSPERKTVPGTQWRMASHDATQYGTRTLAMFLPGRAFPFPKSIYAVEDALRFFIEGQPNATVLDFFAGSGTTAHAVMRLNKQDGGRRKSILVTNNEVSADEQAELRKKGLRPGDAEWEAFGICEYITKPRIKAAITGKTPDGDPIKGDYKFTDEFPMADGFEENVEFFNMTYEAPLTVAHNKAFRRIAPLLWLRAGAEGRRIEKVAAEGFDVADAYGVLFDVDESEKFVDALPGQPNLRVAFIVSDDERAFQAACADLPEGVEGVRLYSSYLTNFEINARADQQ